MLVVATLRWKRKRKRLRYKRRVRQSQHNAVSSLRKSTWSESLASCREEEQEQRTHSVTRHQPFLDAEAYDATGTMLVIIKRSKGMLAAMIDPQKVSAIGLAWWQDALRWWPLGRRTRPTFRMFDTFLAMERGWLCGSLCFRASCRLLWSWLQKLASCLLSSFQPLWCFTDLEDQELRNIAHVFTDPFPTVDPEFRMPWR